MRTSSSAPATDDGAADAEAGLTTTATPELARTPARVRAEEGLASPWLPPSKGLVVPWVDLGSPPSVVPLLADLFEEGSEVGEFSDSEAYEADFFGNELVEEEKEDLAATVASMQIAIQTLELQVAVLDTKAELLAESLSMAESRLERKEAWGDLRADEEVLEWDVVEQPGLVGQLKTQVEDLALHPTEQLDGQRSVEPKKKGKKMQMKPVVEKKIGHAVSPGTTGQVTFQKGAASEALDKKVAPEPSVLEQQSKKVEQQSKIGHAVSPGTTGQVAFQKGAASEAPDKMVAPEPSGLEQQSKKVEQQSKKLQPGSKEAAGFVMKKIGFAEGMKFGPADGLRKQQCKAGAGDTVSQSLAKHKNAQPSKPESGEDDLEIEEEAIRAYEFLLASLAAKAKGNKGKKGDDSEDEDEDDAP